MNQATGDLDELFAREGVCPSCGGELAGGGSCGRCGWGAEKQRREKPLTCPNCGGEMVYPEECGLCGWKVDRVAKSFFAEGEVEKYDEPSGFSEPTRVLIGGIAIIAFALAALAQMC